MLLVDAHVHIYPCFELSSFFTAAYENFFTAAAEVKKSRDVLPVIALADWSRQKWFEKLKVSTRKPDSPEGLLIDGWSVLDTRDDHSVMLEGSAGERMMVLASRKIISSENLEVLALGTTSTFEDGQTLQKTLENIRRHEESPIPVVPWAVGKWLGKRGKVLEEVMKGAKEPYFYLCDNANRPVFWPRPSHFKLADQLGFRTLAGSDPLHFSSDGLRAGRFGFFMPGTLEEDNPAVRFKQMLAELTPTSLRHFGRLESSDTFLRNQIRMQIFKKKWKKELLK